MSTLLSLESLIGKSQEVWTVKEALEVIGDFSMATKLPCATYSIPAQFCRTGSKLRQIEGSICSKCYACDNDGVSNTCWYTTPRVMGPMTHRLLQVLFHPKWTAAMIFLFKNYKWPFFRWHDSGDIQNKEHFENLCKIADACPDTIFWLPTQEWQIIIDYWHKHGHVPLKKLHPNLVIRLSARLENEEPPYFIANKIGVAASSVSNDVKAVNCPASEHGNTCGDCRKCWKQNIVGVTYHLHENGDGDPFNSEFMRDVVKYIDTSLAFGFKSKVEIYDEVAKRFSLPRVKVRLIVMRMKKNYMTRVRILDGSWGSGVQRGNPPKFKIMN